MRHTFAGRQWTILHVKQCPPDDDGRTDNDGLIGLKTKHIYIRRGMSAKRTLETEIHEAIHACWWELNHRRLNHLDAELARFLYHLGYRKHGTP
jgi:hypothetical protein